MKKIILFLMLLTATYGFSQNQKLTGVKTFTSAPVFQNLLQNDSQSKILGIDSNGKVNWRSAATFGITDAPVNGLNYVRNNGSWMTLPPFTIPSLQDVLNTGNAATYKSILLDSGSNLVETLYSYSGFRTSIGSSYLRSTPNSIEGWDGARGVNLNFTGRTKAGYSNFVFADKENGFYTIATTEDYTLDKVLGLNPAAIDKYIYLTRASNPNTSTLDPEALQITTGDTDIIKIDKTGVTKMLTPSYSNLILDLNPVAGKNFTFNFPTSKTGGTRTLATTDDILDISLKANLDSPTFTGTPTLPTGTIATTQTAGNNTTAVATTAFVLANATSSNYTPTLTNITNVSGANLVVALYTRVGNIVTVTIGCNAIVTKANIDSQINISLPITRVSASMQYAGSSSGWGTTYYAGSAVVINTTTASLQFKPAQSGMNSFATTFSYKLD